MAKVLLGLIKTKTDQSIQDPLNKQPIADAEAKLILFNNVVKNTSSAIESYVKSMSKSNDKILKNEFEKTKQYITNYENKSNKAIKGSNYVLLDALVNKTTELQMAIQNEVKILNQNLQSKLFTPFQKFQDEVEEVKKKKRDYIKANPKFEPLSKKLEKAEYDVDTFDKQVKNAQDQNDSEKALKAFKQYNSSLKKKDQYEAKLNNAGSSYYRYTEGLFKCVSEETYLANCFEDYLKLQTEYHSKICKHLEEMIQEVDDAINNHPQKPIFDVNIEEHSRGSSSKNQNSVSKVIHKLIQSIINKNGLNEKDILCKSGVQNKVDTLMEKINSGSFEYFDLNDYGVHDLGSALKQYLRELPDSILSPDLFVLWDKDFNSSSKIEGYKNALKKLSDENIENFENLKYIVKFLSKIIENSELNEMNAKSIVNCFGLSLVEPLYKNYKKDFSFAYNENDLLFYLLSNHHELFPDDNDFAQNKPSGPPHDSNKLSAKINPTISDDDSDSTSTACFKLTNNKVNRSKKHNTNKKKNKNNNNNNNNHHTEGIINHSVIYDDRRYNEHSIKKVDMIL